MMESISSNNIESISTKTEDQDVVRQGSWVADYLLWTGLVLVCVLLAGIIFLSLAVWGMVLTEHTSMNINQVSDQPLGSQEAQNCTRDHNCTSYFHTSISLPIPMFLKSGSKSSNDSNLKNYSSNLNSNSSTSDTEQTALTKLFKINCHFNSTNERIICSNSSKEDIPSSNSSYKKIASISTKENSSTNENIEHSLSLTNESSDRVLQRRHEVRGGQRMSRKQRRRPGGRRLKKQKGKRKSKSSRKEKKPRGGLQSSQLRKEFIAAEQYREWKRNRSAAQLNKHPQAQLAVAQLWQQLIRKGGQFQQIYEGMHNQKFPYPLNTELAKEDLL